MKNAFNSKKYLKIQSSEILKRINFFGGKLYLEFGGKLFDDFHAARVLPGFQPDSKLHMLLTLKDDAEIVMAVNADDIKTNKVRNDLGITYESEVERLIDAYQAAGLYVSSVVFCFYEDGPVLRTFSTKLRKNGIKVYKHYRIAGYPHNLVSIFGSDGFIKNDYVETTRSLVVVTAPGPGSGKMAVCLSQLYHEYHNINNGIKSGYAKYETFTVWNLPLNHPINLAYEAATVDLADVKMIDPYHLEAYGLSATNYNRDIETFPLLRTIFEKIYGTSPYKSPTDMGVNMVGFAITNDAVACKASKDEVIRRYYQAKKNVYLGKFADDTIVKEEAIMTALGVTIEDRPVIKACLDKAKKSKERVVAIQLPNGKIITGKRSILLSASAAALLNALKTLGKIDDSLYLISPQVVVPISDLKTGPLQKENPRIRAEEILLALAIQANNNSLSELALKQLPKLKGAEAHGSCLLPEADLRTLTALGVNVTEEPVGHAHRLYFKNIN
ncbi:MAG: DUF1846 domain-containing protein [Erysipelotrichia bacterium]|nr:DUF1846 domain-containing protein [Erysipelotrichia bacterium]